ncbi:hypothetical protein GCM10023259_040570 [Thermocatellispora tengchongensis]
MDTTAAAEAFNATLKRETLQGARHWPTAHAAAIGTWEKRCSRGRAQGASSGRSVDHAGLERDLPETIDPVAVSAARACRDGPGPGDRGLEGVHQLAGHLGNHAAVPGRQNGHALAEDRLHPAGRPAEP